MKNFIKKLCLFSLFTIFALTNFILISVSVNSCKKPEIYIKKNSGNNIRDTKYLQNLKDPISKDTVVFAFDLHDVLFYKNYKTVSKCVAKTLKKGMLWYVFNPFFMFKAIKLSCKDLIWEDIFYKLTEDYENLEQYKDDFFEISNACCEPIIPMIESLKKLKENGYKLYLLSNIGYDSYQDFKKRFKNIMDLFDGYYLPCKENGYIHKPNPKFYQGFINYLKSQNLGNIQIIFIDDMIKNIDSALELGINSIHCKNPDTVINTLKELNIIK